ncbi:MAG: UrcA family protein [Alphaproteobacteria bacterium]
MMKMKTAAIAALAVAFSTSVFAQAVTEIVVTAPRPTPGTEVRSKTVNFADLDVTKPAGAHTLLTRVTAAAKDVCAPDPGTKDQKAATDYKSCQTGAIDDAVVRLNNALVTAEHAKGAQ